MSEATPKIIVDSEWKSRVETEKENLKRQEEEARSQGPGGLPSASFPMLVSTLVTQALVAMGQIPDPIAGQPELNLPVARHFIDTLAVLEQKTKGNLDADESAMLTDVLHQLRLAFVSINEQAAEPPAGSTLQMP